MLRLTGRELELQLVVVVGEIDLLQLVVVPLRALHLLCRRTVPVNHSSLLNTVPCLGLLAVVIAARALLVLVLGGGHGVLLLLLVLVAGLSSGHLTAVTQTACKLN